MKNTMNSLVNEVVTGMEKVLGIDIEVEFGYAEVSHQLSNEILMETEGVDLRDINRVI